ncbi:MAG TPA: DUF2203 domain-containing protein [Bryobacteraceae bacterium]|nr:DUF2203 domain-containing protein [Bryobacteraceae bacterium]
MPRYFTLANAAQALPQVEKLIREALFLKSDCQTAGDELTATTRHIMMMGGVQVDSNRLNAVKQTRDRSFERLKGILEEIQETGCLVKDLDIGLLDFPTLYRGEEVYLCWKLGESSINFWHPVHEGFGGRRPIDQEFLDNHASK